MRVVPLFFGASMTIATIVSGTFLVAATAATAMLVLIFAAVMSVAAAATF